MAVKQKHAPYVMLAGYAKLAGYTLDQLAAKLHITRRTLDHKINGYSDFTLTEGKYIIELLGQRREDIFLHSDVT